MREIGETVRAAGPASGADDAPPTGRLEIGEASVLIRRRRAHRATPSRRAVRDRHAQAHRAVWKKEHFEDGESGWSPGRVGGWCCATRWSAPFAARDACGRRNRLGRRLGRHRSVALLHLLLGLGLQWRLRAPRPPRRSSAPRDSAAAADFVQASGRALASGRRRGRDRWIPGSLRSLGAGGPVRGAGGVATRVGADRIALATRRRSGRDRADAPRAGRGRTRPLWNPPSEGGYPPAHRASPDGPRGRASTGGARVGRGPDEP